MTDRDAMMAAIIAAPSDDLPRLVFADWLDEHNEAARAEFIRRQVRLAEIERADRKRERELWAALDLSDLPGHGHVRSVESWVSTSAAKFTFTRGFASRVTCDWPAWRDQGDQIRRAQPIEKVVLTSRPVVEHVPGPGRLNMTWRFALDPAGRNLEYDRWPESRVSTTSRPLNPTDDEAMLALLTLRWPAVPGELGPVAFELPPELPPEPTADRVRMFLVSIAPLVPILRRDGVQIDFDRLYNTGLGIDYQEG